MDTEINLGAVIAQRELTITGTDGRVLVSVGTPKYIGDGRDWACPYTITGLRKPIHGHAHGIDALQSLQLVSTAIRSDLEKTDAALSFLDQSNWQSAFPQEIRDLGEAALRERIERLIVEEQSRWLEEQGLPTAARDVGGETKAEQIMDF